MKTLKILLILFSLNVMIACDKDSDDIALSSAEANELNLIVQQGEWQISNFVMNGQNNTANYADYFFQFDENNILKAISEGDQMNGTWRISNDSGDEFDSYNDVDFNIFFPGDSKFGDLTNNYNVISANNQEIKLNMQENPTSNTAILTLSKN